MEAGRSSKTSVPMSVFHFTSHHVPKVRVFIPIAVHILRQSVQDCPAITYPQLSSLHCKFYVWIFLLQVALPRIKYNGRLSDIISFFQTKFVCVGSKYEAKELQALSDVVGQNALDFSLLSIANVSENPKPFCSHKIRVVCKGVQCDS